MFPSTLTEQVAFESVVLELTQRPTRAWMPVFAAAFVGCVAGICAWQGFGFLSLGAWALALLSMLGPRRRVRIEVGPARVVVTGWSGWPPLPRRRVLPLEGLRVEVRRWTRARGDDTVTFLLIGPDGAVRVPALETSPGDAARLERRFDDLRAFARALQGDGPVAEPEALRELRQRLLE